MDGDVRDLERKADQGDLRAQTQLHRLRLRLTPTRLQEIDNLLDALARRMKQRSGSTSRSR